MRRYFDVNSVAVKCYYPNAYDGRITLFRSSEGYQYSEQRSPDVLLGWGKIATGGVEQYSIPGTHMQIMREPSVGILGEKLTACLKRAKQPTDVRTGDRVAS